VFTKALGRQGGHDLRGGLDLFHGEGKSSPHAVNRNVAGTAAQGLLEKGRKCPPLKRREDAARFGWLRAED